MSIHACGENGHNWRGGPVRCECEWCGKDYDRPRAQVNSSVHHFCSPVCRSAWQRENTRGDASPHWRGGSVGYYRGQDWLIQRRLARERDNHTCQVCGATRDGLGMELDVHHIIPFREFESYHEANHIDNLVCLCRRCHIGVEYHGEAPTGLRCLLVPGGSDTGASEVIILGQACQEIPIG